MRGVRVSPLALVACALVACVAACGRPARPPRPTAEVTGAVTYDGKPLPEGTIIFSTPAQGFFESFAIRDGRFQGKACLGMRRIEIQAYRDSAPVPAGTPGFPSGGTWKENYLPARYSDMSDLKAEVTSAGPNDFSFSLTSDRP
jgi:hypothetical protein